jgi:hypothetical protein
LAYRVHDLSRHLISAVCNIETNRATVQLRCAGNKPGAVPIILNDFSALNIPEASAKFDFYG